MRRWYANRPDFGVFRRPTGKRKVFIESAQLVDILGQAVSRGRNAVFFVKAFGEIRQVVKSAAKGDIGDALIGN
jgi:hypothetical protein